MKIRIITDSNCDLPPEYIKEKQIEIIPFHYSIGGSEYIDDFGSSLSYSEFYKKLDSGLISTTSQISPIEFESIFMKYIESGVSIIYIGFSSALSGTYNNACLARDNILEVYQDANIAIIDSMRASSGQGLLVYKTVSLMNSGKTFNEIVDLINTDKLNIKTLFTVNSLEHLKRGGRLTATSAVFGYLLEIKPLLEINESGELVSKGIVRGRKKSINYLFDSVIAEIDDDVNQTIIITHADCIEEVINLKNRIQTKLNLSLIIINDLCPTIGSHSGPGTIAIAYTKKKTKD